MFISLSAIVGSGWLFSAFYAARLAGPAALLTWVIGGCISIFIAFVFAELCSMLPVSGASVRIPHYTHGTIVSFTFAWVIWLTYVSTLAIEAQAVIQYASFYFPELTHANGGLTGQGLLFATIVLFLVSAINSYSIHWLMRTNSALTVIKILIPLVIVVGLLFVTWPKHSIVHPAASSFSPNGIHGILAALIGGGVIFAFTGFKLGAELAGEAKRPAIAVPFAVIASVFIAMIVFIALQAGFLSSVEPANLIHGWKHLNLGNDLSPFASIFKQEHIHWLLPILFAGAIIGPLAASLMYCSTANRAIYGMAKNGQAPRFFKKLNSHNHPFYAVILNFVVALLMFAPLPGWNKMVAFLTSLLALSYVTGPIALLSLRMQAPKQFRPIRLPFAILWCYIAFFICTLLTYWSGWTIISKMSIALIIGYVLFFGYRLVSKRPLDYHFKASLWLWPYLIGITLISYAGNFGNGHHLMSVTQVWLTLAIFCAIILTLAVSVRLSPEHADNYISKLPIYGKNPTQ